MSYTGTIPKTQFPLETSQYFTDGCTGQYKDKNNFANMCSHEQDFGLKGEYNFLATSHWKSACDKFP